MYRTVNNRFKKWLEPENLILIEGWKSHDGLTEAQIAKHIGIKEETLLRWKETYPEIKDALKKSREDLDREVEEIFGKTVLGNSFYELVKSGKYKIEITIS